MQMKWILIGMVAAGAAILIVSIHACRRLYKVVPSSLQPKWLILTSLIFSFIIGYCGYLFVQFFNIDFPLEILVSTIFFCGALFVYGIISLIHQTLHELRRLTDHLEVEVDKRTAQLNALNQSLEESGRELSQQNSFLNTVINALPHPFYVINTNSYEVVLANTISGFDLSKAQRTCHQLTHGISYPCHGEDHPCPIEEIKKSSEPVVVEHVHLNGQGEKRIVEVHGYPIWDESGKLIQVIEYVLDVTEKKQIENELIKARILAEAASAAKGEFLANMSHEIRTPMNAIIGLSHLALQTDLDHKQRDYINKVHGSANHLLGILNDILDISKIEAGRLTLVDVPFELHCLIDDVVSTMSVSASNKGLELLVSIQNNLPTTFLGDALRLRQILINLVGNAIKFTPSGTVRVQVSADADSNDDKIPLKFSVIDSGIGVSPDQIDLIFDSFEQGDNSNTRHFGGTGLGLSICNQLITLMGGRIWAESIVDTGSSFHFTVSLQPHEEKKSSGQGPIDPCLREDFNGLRILLVDDNEVNREVASMMLEEKHLVTTATNGLEALAALAADDFDIILMDVQMPEMDGIGATTTIRTLEDGLPAGVELPRELRAPLAEKLKGKHIPIIAMTAHAMGEIEGQCLSVGMDGYISKPFQYQQLLNALRRVKKSSQV